jgi:predicted DNA-binding protein (UPF0251 family)
MGRKKKCRTIHIDMDKVCRRFGPLDGSEADDCVVLESDELQALKYKDMDHKTIVEAALLMGVSKSVFGDIYKHAREKVVDAVVSGKEILVVCS